jgi:hypothetical protein
VILAAFASVASADGIYTQNFDGMSTGTTAPTGWSVYGIGGNVDTFTPTDDPVNTHTPPTGSAITGGTAGGITAATANQGDTGQKTAGGYNWDLGSGNRSLGTSPTGNAGVALQAIVTNTTGGALTHIGISYDVNVLTYTTNNNGTNNPPYTGKEELPGYWLFYSLDNGATYTNVSALNGDGHTWANVVGTVHESLADLTLSGTWANGGSLYLRWFDDNAQGPSPDQKIGLDNVVIGTVATTPEPTSLVLLGLGGLALLRKRNRK